MPSQCAVCFIETKKSCGSCKTLFFCNEEHQLALWKSHKPICGGLGRNEEEEEFRSPLLSESECKVIRNFLSWKEFELPSYTPIPVSKENPNPLSTFVNNHLLHLSSLPSVSLTLLLAQYRIRITAVAPPSFNAATTHHPSLFPSYQISSLLLKAKILPHSTKNHFFRVLYNFFALQYVQGLYGVDREELDLQLKELENIVDELETLGKKGGALLRCYLSHIRIKEMILREKMDDIIEDDEFDRRNEEETERIEKILRTFGNVLAI